MPNILITGAAGYLGGSLVADMLSSTTPALADARLYAAVRSKEQANALSKLDVIVLRLDLSDEKAVVDAVLNNEITIVVHTASSLISALAKNLIAALGKQKERRGADVHFVHTSGLSAFYPNTGWPSGAFNDTDAIFATEKRLADSFPLRRTDVDVIEYAKSCGVTSYVVVPSNVYGKGTGPWNRLSIVLPIYISTAIERKQVYIFAKDTTTSAVHISDLTILYGRIIERIIKHDALASGERGYYFATTHSVSWHQIASHLVSALHASNLVETKEVGIWETDEQAAKMLGVPDAFVKPLWNSGDEVVVHNEERLGWKAVWSEEKFYEKFGEEVENVVELGKAKSSLMESLKLAAQG